jgi:hypothetical protein
VSCHVANWASRVDHSSVLDSMLPKPSCSFLLKNVSTTIAEAMSLAETVAVAESVVGAGTFRSVYGMVRGLTGNAHQTATAAAAAAAAQLANVNPVRQWHFRRGQQKAAPPGVQWSARGLCTRARGLCTSMVAEQMWEKEVEKGGEAGVHCRNMTTPYSADDAKRSSQALGMSASRDRDAHV